VDEIQLARSVLFLCSPFGLFHQTDVSTRCVPFCSFRFNFSLCQVFNVSSDDCLLKVEPFLPDPHHSSITVHRRKMNSVFSCNDCAYVAGVRGPTPISCGRRVACCKSVMEPARQQLAVHPVGAVCSCSLGHNSLRTCESTL
jgi:hypothetical protein